MRKLIKVLTTFVITLLLTLVVSAPKTEAAITGEDVSELRGVWVSTVSNIDISKQNGTTQKAIKEYQGKLTAILDKVENFGLNAIFFQIRPANDALYESAYNPWSEFLAGFGVNPGWDMLSWFINEAHARGIELHAWLNPYRVTASQVSGDIKQAKLDLRAKTLKVAPELDSPLTIKDDEEFLSTIVMGAEGKLILNPAKERTIEHIEKTIEEIITKYNVDGIHFDDYFYPNGGTEADVTDYNAYVKDGGSLNIDDWRRSNVDNMVERVHNLIEKHNNDNPNSSVAFGISPAAVWAPNNTNCADRGQPGGMNVICQSYSSYTDLYADTKKWVEEEWLDYILPQVYYNFGDDYKEIVKWWANVVSKTDVKLYIGTAIYRVSEWKDGLVIDKQFDYNNSTEFLKKNVSGFVLFSYRNLVSSESNTVTAQNTITTYCLKDALHPTYGYQKGTVNEKVDVTIYKTQKDYIIKFNEIENANGYVIYGVEKGSTEYNFADPTIPIKEAINQIDGTKEHILKVTQNSVAKFDYVLRVYDVNNNPANYTVISFDNALENEGPIVVHNLDSNKKYELGETIEIVVNVDSPAELPLNVAMEVSINGGNYLTNYYLVDNGDGTYSYEFVTFKEGTLSFKFIASDGDKEKVVEVGPISVGEQTEEPEDKPEKPSGSTGSGMSCNFGSFMILPVIAGIALIILRKREF